MTKKCYASTIIDLAKKQVGVVEKPTNKVKYNKWFYGKDVSGDAYPWCMAFQSWLFYKCGRLDLIGGKSASCAQTVAWFKKNKQWHSKPKVGDLVFFTFSHVELVIGINSDGSVNTIGGNTSADDKGSQRNGGQVAKKHRTASILGYGRPKYDKKPKTLTKLKCRLYKQCNVQQGSYCGITVGSQITFVKDMKNGWSKCKYGDYTGYIKNTAIKKDGLSDYPTATILVDNCPFRKKNKKGSELIGKLPKGKKVKKIGGGKYWVNIIADGKKGYVFHSKIK